MTASGPNPPPSTPPRRDYDWGATSDVVWTGKDPGSPSGQQTFGTLFEALEFIMYRLHPAAGTVVVVHPETGGSLFGMTQIQEAWDQVR